jgi:hypothetical protein
MLSLSIVSSSGRKIGQPVYPQLCIRARAAAGRMEHQ